MMRLLLLALILFAACAPILRATDVLPVPPVVIEPRVLP